MGKHRPRQVRRDRLQEDEDNHSRPSWNGFTRSDSLSRDNHHTPKSHHRSDWFTADQSNLPGGPRIRNPFDQQNTTRSNPSHNPSKTSRSYHRQQTQSRTCGHACERNLQQLKKGLMRTFERALAQIEQWYPDQISGDEMEWQIENVVEIRPSVSVNQDWFCDQAKVSIPTLSSIPAAPSSALNRDHCTAGDLMHEYGSGGVEPRNSFGGSNTTTNFCFGKSGNFSAACGNS